MRKESHARLAGLASLRPSEASALITKTDWSASDVGDPSTWSTSLVGYVSMILEMPTPAILFWGKNQTQIYNDGYAEIMGPRHPKYFGARYRDCWPDTYPVIQPWMDRVMCGETIHVTDQHFELTRHGFSEEAFFTFTFSPLRDDDGTIAGIFQPVVEVTQAVIARRREETLRRLATSEGSAVESIRATLAANDKDIPFSLLFLDGALAAATGFPNRPPETFVSKAAAIARAAEASGEPRTVSSVPSELGAHIGPWPEPTRTAFVVPIGTRGAVVIGVSPRRPFDEPYRAFLLSCGRQITATLAAETARHTEEELLRREREAHRDAELQREHLAALLTQAPAPVVVLRGERLIIELANPYACKVWMRRHEDVINRPFVEALPEIKGQPFEDLLLGVLRTGVAHVGTETKAVLAGPDGRMQDVWFTFVYSPLRLPDGRVDGVLVLAFDVTEQVRAREQTDALRSAAESANRVKDEFFAVLGHELRNPLAPILTALQLMKARNVPQVEREREIIERQSQHLVRLVDDLLDVSRITRGKIELRKERVELASVVMRAVEMAAPLMEQRRQQLQLDVTAEGHLVDADPARLSQAVANLLVNAAKFTEPGGHIRVRTSGAGDRLSVTVRDDGIGIEPAMLSKIFEAFAQAGQPLDRQHGGLGLGLAIVRGIVELHGGDVSASSEGPGKGSEFVLRLPAAEGGRAMRTPRAVPTSMPQRLAEGAKSILLVDDNEDAAIVLADWLRAAGHRVEVAHDGPTALRLAQTRPPDVAVLDIGLPVMDGYELAKQLRATTGLERVPLIAVTGYGREADRATSEQAGFDAHLVKPVDPQRIDALVRSISRRAATH